MIKDERKTKKQLVTELAEMRQRIAELEASETERSRVEEALRESEQNFRDLVESLLDGVAIADENTHHIYVNPRYAEITGYSVDEMLNMAGWDFSRPEDIPKFKQRMKKRMTDEPHTREYERVIVRKDGTEVLTETSTTTTVWQGKKRPMAIIRDITDRKRAEEALRESEERYRTVVEHQTDLICRFLPDGTLTFANQAYCRYYGKQCQELIGRSFMSHVPPEERERVAQHLASFSQEKPVATIEHRAVAAGGKVRWQQWINRPMFDEQGKVTEFQAAGRDVTERKQAEEALRQSESFLQSVFDGIQDGISVLDGNLTIIRVNSWMKGMYASQAPLQGKKCYAVYQQRESPCPWCPSLPTLKTGKMHSETVPYPSEENPAGWIDLAAFPLKDTTGQVVGVIEHVKDITERMRAEEALRESEERYRSFVQNFRGIAFRGRMDFTPIFFHGAVKEITGYTEREFLGGKPRWDQVIHPEDLPALMTEDEERLHSIPYSYEREYRIVRKDGAVRWVHEVIQSVCDDSGKPAIIQGAIYDITERKRAEEALRESERRYRLLAENVTDIIWTMDMNLRYTYFSPSVTRTTGYSVEEAMALTLEDVLTPASLETAMKVLAEEMIVEEAEQKDLSRSLTMDLEQYRKDGSTNWVEATVTGLRDSGGRLVEMLGVSRDITERKRAERERERLLAQIQEQAQRVQQIIATVPEGVLLLDRSGHVVLANPLGKKDLATLAGVQVGDTLTRLGDRPLAELLTSPPKGLWHEVTADGLHFEIIARPLDIELESEELALSMAEEWVLVIRDVTQEREIQRRVQRQERLAAVGQLAGGIAHDFNNLLTTIMLYAQIPLSKSDLPPNAIRSFETILDESRQAAKLVQQILDFSRRSPIETSPMDLGLFVQKTLRVLERTIPENINLRFAAGPEEYVVSADPTRIQQMLMNLATNGRDAMPNGGEMRFELSRVQVQPGAEPPVAEMGSGEWVCLAVSDTGTGIPPDALARIFEPFFTTKEVGQGTGLGLAQVHGIVAQHLGRIGVETEVGQGTTFRVYLPASGVEEEVVEERALSIPQGQGETILLVEDNENLREGGQNLLESSGYRVLTAANGREALEVCRTVKEIALVITDIVMPEMGGKQLMQELGRAIPALKVLALTGYAMEESREELKEAGFLDVVYKPFEVDTLAQVVRRALDQD